MPGLWRKISVNCGNEQEKAGSDAFFATAELTHFLSFLSHLLCSSPKRWRRPPFCTVCAASRAGRTDTQVFNALCFRVATESLVARCPRPCATLSVAVCNVAHAHGQRARPVSEMDFPSLQMASCLVRTISPLLIHSTHRSVGTGRGRVCRACTRRR